jgi:hypothetical protein
MELLRLDDAGSTTPQRKKSSKGMLVVGLVATLFGISSAFASSTITINGAAPIALGQGVTAVTACDTAISVVPATEMRVETGTPTFFMTSLAFGGIDVRKSDSSTAGLGCGGKIFDIQIFNKDNVPYTCGQLNPPTRIREVGGDLMTLNCDTDKLSFNVAEASDGDRTYAISFASAPSEISYITLVTREAI